MRVSLPYGDRTVFFNVDDRVFIRAYDPPSVRETADFRAEVERAMDNPIGTAGLDKIVTMGSTVNIIVDDISRPTPVDRILPVLLDRLAACGVAEERIRIIVALGSHRYMTPAELAKRIGPAVCARYAVVNSEFRDRDGLVCAGKTPDGLDIYAAKIALESDVRIGIGNLAPHPVMGWSGGGKILYPGVAGEDTVAYFHLKGSLYDENMFGWDTTPIREMMESWVDTIGLDFVINTVLTSELRLYKAVAGHYVGAQREGVRIAKEVLGCKVEEKADVAVVSSHPADQDFWQSPKGMYGAEPALKGDRGGTLILVSPNYEGLGSHPELPEWMGRDDGDGMIRRILAGERFEGDALAMAIGNNMSKLRRRRKLIVVGDGVSTEEMARCGCARYPIDGLQQAVDDAIAGYPGCRLAAVSKGADTVLYEAPPAGTHKVITESTNSWR